MSFRSIGLAAALGFAAACSSTQSISSAARLTHGVASGEITDRSAVLWTRCPGGNRASVRLRGGDRELATQLPIDAEADWTGRVWVDGLTASTRYEYSIECRSTAHGNFTTAPLPTSTRPVRIAWGGDIGGQNSCRDAVDGYSVFSRIVDADPHLFVALGDMVYVDDRCTETGRYGNVQVPGPAAADDLATLRRHWAYNRADPHLQALTARIPYVGIWDDHEIRNDSGPDDDRERNSNVKMLAVARRGLLEYLPMIPPAEDPNRLYRRLRWGGHAELFILDTRQYRDRNDRPDLASAGKTLLGTTQRAWLIDSLRNSDATWRIVVSSVPLSIPTGSDPDERDGWANHGGNSGFEREATAILRSAAEENMRNLVWITTDVHFATGFRYRPFDDHPDFVVHEFVSGPLNAGVFPRYDLDPTFNPERLYLWGPESPDDIESHQQALEWYNFGLIDIDAAGNMAVAIVNAKGRRVAEVRLPSPD